VFFEPNKLCRNAFYGLTLLKIKTQPNFISMNPVINRNVFFVKEHVGAFKASNSFDIYDPEKSADFDELSGSKS
jgi:hypothetical protein